MWDHSLPMTRSRGRRTRSGLKQRSNDERVAGELRVFFVRPTGSRDLCWAAAELAADGPGVLGLPCER
jgi:hypothetical protein